MSKLFLLKLYSLACKVDGLDFPYSRWKSEQELWAQAVRQRERVSWARKSVSSSSSSFLPSPIFERSSRWCSSDVSPHRHWKVSTKPNVPLGSIHEKRSPLTLEFLPFPHSLPPSRSIPSLSLQAQLHRRRTPRRPSLIFKLYQFVMSLQKVEIDFVSYLSFQRFVVF